MKKFRSMRLEAVVLAALMVVATAAGVMALLTETEAAPRCLCPQVYAPVVCDNGQTYPNLCVANCRHAHGCVPVPILPPPI